MDTERFHHFQLVAKSRASKIYCAIDRQLNRKVAIKAIAIDQHRNNPEVEIHKELCHPNIIKLIDVFRDSTCQYMVFPWCKNGSLASKLCQTSWSIEDRIGVFQQLLQAISFLHSRDIVHGDIKPQNCLLDDHGFILLADFGNARHKQSNVDLESKFVGSPAYMAPELLRQESSVSKASDIYALGIVLYELLSRENAFSENLSASIHQSLQDRKLTIDKTSWNDRTCLTDWHAVISLATHRQRERRYQSVDDLLGEVRSIVDGRPIKSRPWGVPERFVRWTKREPRTTRWILASVLILVFSLTAAILGWVRSNTRFREMQEIRTNYDKITTELEAKQIELKRVLEQIEINTRIAENAATEVSIHERDANSKDMALASTGQLSTEIQRANERLLQDISSAKLEIDSANTLQRTRLEQEAMVQKMIERKGRLEAYFHSIKQVESLIERNDRESALIVLNKTDLQCRGLEFSILEDQLDGGKSVAIQYLSPAPGEGNGKTPVLASELEKGVIPVIGSSSFIAVYKSKSYSFHLMQCSKNRKPQVVGILAARKAWANDILCGAFVSSDGNGVLLHFRKKDADGSKDKSVRLVETKFEIDGEGNRSWTILREFLPDMNIFELRYDNPGRVICLGTKGDTSCVWSSINQSAIWTSKGEITWYLKDLRPESDFVFYHEGQRHRQSEIIWIRVGKDNSVVECGSRSIGEHDPRAYPLTRRALYVERGGLFGATVSKLSQSETEYGDDKIQFSLSRSCSDTVFCSFFPSLASDSLILRSNIEGLASCFWESEPSDRRLKENFTFLKNDGLVEPLPIFTNRIYKISDRLQNSAEKILNRPTINQEEFELGMNRFLDFVGDKALKQLIEIEN